MNKTIAWRKPTSEEIAFVQKHWLPQLMRSVFKNRVEAIQNGDFNVSRATATRVLPDISIDAHVQAISLYGEPVLSKKTGFAPEKMFINFPVHFAKYYFGKDRTNFPILLIQFENDPYYIAVPAREDFK